MADSAIGSLPAIQIMQNADLFVLEQNGEAMKLSGELLASFIDRQITRVKVYEVAATAEYNARYYDTGDDEGLLELWIPRGVGIASISDPVVSGLNKTYTITFDKPASASAATTKQFTVKDGNAITGIVALDDDHPPGGLDRYQVTFSEGNAFEFEVYNGADGISAPGNDDPKMDGTKSAGVKTQFSRQDHVHPIDTSRQKKLIEVTVNITASSTEAQIGSLTDASINANMKVIKSIVSSRGAQTSDWTVATYDTAPQLRITGTASEAMTVTLILAEM